jgi:hypothetical protein
MQSEKTIAAHQGRPPALHKVVSAFFIGNQNKKRERRTGILGRLQGKGTQKHFR